MRALGWDTGDIEEVQRELKVKRSVNPVDYAMLSVHTPRLFLYQLHQDAGVFENAYVYMRQYY